MGGPRNRVHERVVLHELCELDVNEPLHSFLLVFGSWNRAEVFKETLEVNVWGSR
jgi:hypothetical protein